MTKTFGSHFIQGGKKTKKAIKNEIQTRAKERYILVAIESGEASQNSLSPFQSVMTPPAPSITGINARKSYG